MTVIAIDGPLGTCTNEVASAIARRLHLKTVDDQLIETLTAEWLKIDAACVHGAFEVRASRWNLWRQPRRSLRVAAQKIVELATEGDVIIKGCAAAQILCSVPHVLRVCVGYPKHSVTQPLWLRWYSLRCLRVYDVVFAPRVSVQTCVERLAQDVEFGETAASRAALARLLEAARRNAGCVGESRGPSFLYVELGRERVRVEHTLSSEERISCVETHLRGVNRYADWTKTSMLAGERLAFH